MKVIPLYLPQFHRIPENDAWWGEGFTEWVNVRSAKPLYEGHYQPRVPLNGNYYDLSEVETLRWQCKIAREHGIYGFCFYHYWFNGHLLLEKPMEMLLAHPEIETRYCVCWANHDWTDAWKRKEGKEAVLIAHDFDDEADWDAHFNYLLPFFRDPRYMTEDGCPLMLIYVPQLIGKIRRMTDRWIALARENGLKGIKFVYQSVSASIDHSWDRTNFAYGIQFHPGYVMQYSSSAMRRALFSWMVRRARAIKRFLGIHQSVFGGPDKVRIYDYEEYWKRIVRLKPESDKMLPSAFVDWDNTPRKQQRGYVFQGASPAVFGLYFKQLVERTRTVYHTDKIFVFAWNEWAEGGYLEPDERYGYAYLDAIKDALIELKEWPE